MRALLLPTAATGGPRGLEFPEPPPHPKERRKPVASFLKHLPVVSGLTLLSRVAGLARDAALAHILGAQWVMDAYSMAFRLPNLLRQLLGEGALTAAFIPVFTRYLEKEGRQAASRFMSLLIVLLVTTLAAVTLVADGALLALRYLTEPASKWHLIFGLSAVLFPFGIMVCLVALLQAALACRRHFALPALAPVLLNLFIIAGAVTAGILLAGDTISQVYLIAVFILLAGLVEIAVQVPAMRWTGLVFRPAWDLKDAGVRRVLELLGPVIVAVGVVQLNVFMDSLIANLLSPSEGGGETFRLGPWELAYPMRIGAASVLYYGPLIYQFPLGVFGIALATVVFPVLAQYAARQDLVGMARTASHALRLTVFIGVPAGLGIILVCDPLVRLVFNHGKFAQSPEAVARTVWVASLFSLGLWSYQANHILTRAFYAMEQITTPRRIAMLSAGLNFACNLTLVWPMAEGGLALSTVISALFQTAALAWILQQRCTHLEWRAIGASAARTVLAAAIMGAAAWAAIWQALPRLMPDGRPLYGAQLAAGVVLGGAVFIAAARLMKMSELRDLLARGRGEAPPGPPPAPSPAESPAPAASGGRPLEKDGPAR
ncbi:MAG: murein biosynthesis integral membrane protein MurJ [Planctomycetes bacterium]|nr:murein biosynthesis integral membrane protein MurJ [Planctomycetota bacterium]